MWADSAREINFWVDMLASAVNRVKSIYIDKRRTDAEGVPVLITSGNGLVVYCAGRAVFARKIAHGDGRKNEVFMLEAKAGDEHKLGSHLKGVRFGCLAGSGYLSAEEGGAVGLETQPSEAGLWALESSDRGTGDVKVRNLRSGRYLNLDGDGRVRADANKPKGGSEMRILHALRWQTNARRRNVMIRPINSSRALTSRGGTLTTTDFNQKPQRKIGETEAFEMAFDYLSSLATLTSRSDGELVQMQRDGTIRLASHGWFAVELHGHQIALRGPHGYLSAPRDGSLKINRDTTPRNSELFLLCNPPTQLPTESSEIPVDLTVERIANGVRRVRASVHIPTQASFPYQAVKDWDQLENIVDKIDKCERFATTDAKMDRIVGRSPLAGAYYVQMVQKHHFLFFRKTDKVVLEAHEDEENLFLRTSMVKSGLLRVYVSEWRAQRDVKQPETHSVLHLQVDFAPSIPVPGFIIDGIIRHDTTDTMRELREHCIRRARGS